MVLMIFHINVKRRVVPVLYGLRFKRLRLLNTQAASPDLVWICPEINSPPQENGVYMRYTADPNTTLNHGQRFVQKGSWLTFLKPCVQEEAPHSCACTPSPGSDSHGSNGKTPDKESVLSAGSQLEISNCSLQGAPSVLPQIVHPVLCICLFQMTWQMLVMGCPVLWMSYCVCLNVC